MDVWSSRREQSLCPEGESRAGSAAWLEGSSLEGRLEGGLGLGQMPVPSQATEDRQLALDHRKGLLPPEPWAGKVPPRGGLRPGRLQGALVRAQRTRQPSWAWEGGPRAMCRPGPLQAFPRSLRPGGRNVAGWLGPAEQMAPSGGRVPS